MYDRGRDYYSKNCFLFKKHQVLQLYRDGKEEEKHLVLQLVKESQEGMSRRGYFFHFLSYSDIELQA